MKRTPRHRKPVELIIDERTELTDSQMRDQLRDVSDLINVNRPTLAIGAVFEGKLVDILKLPSFLPPNYASQLPPPLLELYACFYY